MPYAYSASVWSFAHMPLGFPIATVPSACGIEQGFSSCGSWPQMGSQNVILGLRNQLAWQIRYNNFCKIYKKIESRPAVNLYLRFLSLAQTDKLYHELQWIMLIKRELKWNMLIKREHWAFYWPKCSCINLADVWTVNLLVHVTCLD